ncbi:hypothetical protein HYV44_01720 [Candidatus Microgenomates bacterium]|nr:hypothetical protein [Candidatus Microgenomates bacterium]
MNNELPPHNIEKGFSQIEAEMKKRGFVYAGLESLTKFKFSDGAKFNAVPTQTKDDVVGKYIQKYKKEGVDIEIELIDKTGMDERQQSVYVFIRKK